MRVALSGSTGFIGRALHAALSQAGYDVLRIARRSPAPGELLLDTEARRFDWQRSGLDSLGELDAVIHLAGEPLTLSRWDAVKRDAIRSSRIVSTDLLARSIADSAARPAAFITMSAVGYYGDRGDEVLTEESARGSGFLADLCQAWEQAAQPAADVGVRVVHARTGLVLGRGGGLLAQLKPLFALGLGGRLGDGRQWMSPISLADEIRALMLLVASSDLRGPFNLTGPEPIRNREFTEALGREFHRPAILRVPATALRVAVGQIAADEMALVSQRAVPQRLDRAGFTFEHPTIASMLSASR